MLLICGWSVCVVLRWWSSQERTCATAQSSSPVDHHVTSCRHGDASPTAQSYVGDDADQLMVSDVGAIDLSMKKRRSSSSCSPCKRPPTLPPAPPCSSVSKSSTVTDTASSSTADETATAAAMTDALYSLLSQPSTYGSGGVAAGSAEQAALAQLLVSQQLAAGVGVGSDLQPLSVAAAAAAAAATGLFPPLFDGVSGLFYPPSLLAALAATAHGSTSSADSNQQPALNSDKSASSSSSHRRSTGRRRGGRGTRNSSMFISSLFPTAQQQSASLRPALSGDEVKSGRGGTGRGSRGVSRARGRHRTAAGSDALPQLAYLELEVSDRH